MHQMHQRKKLLGSLCMLVSHMRNLTTQGKWLLRNFLVKEPHKKVAWMVLRGNISMENWHHFDHKAHAQLAPGKRKEEAIFSPDGFFIKCSTGILESLSNEGLMKS